MFEKFDWAVNKVISAVVFWCFALLVIMTAAQVYVRMFTTASLTWSEELSTFVMIWMVLSASVLVFRNKGHIWVENITNGLTGETKQIVLAVSNLASLLFLLVVSYGAFTLLPTVHGQLSPACKIPMSYVYSAVPFSFVLTCVYAAHDIYLELKSPTRSKG